MASIKYNPSGQKGRISYNTDIVSGIVILSLQETEGIELVSSKSRGIKLCFEKEGIFADISVIAHYGYNVPQLAFSIQQTVKQMVESMTKFKVAKIDVHIQSVVFAKNSPPPVEQSSEQNSDQNAESKNS